MNERFGVDPMAINSSFELKHLMSYFGPFAGRYVAAMPDDWVGLIQERFNGLSDLEKSRASTLLRRARESLCILNARVKWNDQVGWLENSRILIDSGKSPLTGFISCNTSPPVTHALHDLDLPPTSEERIFGTSNEYMRIVSVLLDNSTEVLFIDPYLSPLKNNYRRFLVELFARAFQAPRRQIFVYARYSSVMDRGDPQVLEKDVVNVMNGIVSAARGSGSGELNYLLVDDDSDQDKLHGRYMLTVKGGVRFDQGFQVLPKGRKMDVAPVGKDIHGHLFDYFSPGNCRLNVKWQHSWHV